MSNIWGSIAVLTNQIIDELKLKYPDQDIQFEDWETHANIAELPNSDLIGPTSLAITEVSPQFIEFEFAISVSTYATDSNLFRLRDYIGTIFEKLRPEQKLVYYDAETAAPLTFMIVTDGTTIAPMTRADVRPVQYVQCSVVLEPSGSVVND